MSSALYVIAGPNGAGKTTFAREFLPYYAECKNFINADLIALGVSPFSPDAVAFRAGRMMLEEISYYVERGDDFGFETTLSGRGYLRLIRQVKEEGYEVHFFFLTLPDVDLALKRVEARVLGGGHNVPEQVICRRFDRSLHNFLTLYRQLGDSWTLFDNSGAIPTVTAFEVDGDLRIIDRKAYEALIERYGKQ
jgi:predicted ABC-type ATPase